MHGIEHNSQNTFYRSPFGAVEKGTSVKISLAVGDFGSPVSVQLIVLDNGQEEIFNLPYTTELAEKYIYSTSINTCSLGVMWYYFKIQTPQSDLYYGNNGENFGGYGQVYDHVPEHKFQITVYKSSYHTPDWFKNTIVYQIFPDRFFNGTDDSSFLGDRTDIIKRGWGDMPYYKAEQFGGTYLSNDFFGGNLDGIIKKLPYLKQLGVGAIYLNPIFRAYSNHKYDTGDYKEIDPMFGDDKTFQKLCSQADILGVRIILDGVFNHTGSDSRYFNMQGTYDDTGAYQSANSPYYDWYQFTEYPDKYDCWWGIKTLPHVNEDSESYRDYILNGDDSVVKHWLREGAKGWRLDVVDELPDFFVKELRIAVKSVDPDAVIIGEVWEDASHKVSYDELREYFIGDELDSVMNYPLRGALLDFACGHIDALGFHRRIMSLKENYPKESFYSLLNFISTHDVERAITILSDVPQGLDKDAKAIYKIQFEQYENAKQKLKSVVAMQMLLPGVPCIFYGDEAGMQGFADPFCRMTYPWGSEDSEIMEWYQTITAIRNKNDVFIDGEFETVYKIGGVYGFIRYDANDMYVVLSNFSQNFQTVRVDLARFGVGEMNSVLGEEYQYSHDGVFFIDLPHAWVKVFKCKSE